jgi:UrcA family protein
MTRILIGIAAGLLAVTSVSTIALAEDTGSVTVQASRVVNAKTVGHTASGVPIVDVSMSYGVSAAGLDLVSHAGVVELEKRVNDAAHAACKELGRQYPESLPNDAECAKTAAEKAIVKVHELAAAAANKAGR